MLLSLMSVNHGNIITAMSQDVYCHDYHVVHLGTPIVMTDDNKRTKWKTDYLSFGEIYNESPTQWKQGHFPRLGEAFLINSKKKKNRFSNNFLTTNYAQFVVK